MHYLVTGGAGFIGSNLTARLLDAGHTVFVLDNLSTGTRNNVEQFRWRSKYTFFEKDVRGLGVVPSDGGTFHLACPASPKAYQADAVETLLTAFLGTKMVLDNAMLTETPVLIASTSEVYGDPDVHPQPETYWGHVNPIGPRSCYDEGKRAAETLALDYHRQYGAEIRVARIFNTYGPNMQPDDGRVVSNFIVQALRGADLTIYGDGLQTRSLCYVDDTVSGLIALMESGHPGPVNIGNPHDVTIRELAETVIRLVGGPSRISYLEAAQDDPYRRCPDITRAKNMGWAPTVGLEDGLKETISYFKRVL